MSIPAIPGTIVIQAITHDGNAVIHGYRDSFDLHRDDLIMCAAVEFFYAKKRGVEITPRQLWDAVMKDIPYPDDEPSDAQMRDGAAMAKHG